MLLIVCTTGCGRAANTASGTDGGALWDALDSSDQNEEDGAIEADLGSTAPDISAEHGGLHEGSDHMSPSGDSGDTPGQGGTDAGSDALLCRLEFPTGEAGCAIGDDLQPIEGSISASVAVVSIDDVASDACGGLGMPSAAPGSSSGGGAGKRIVVSSGTGRWTVYASIPDLPLDVIKQGDQLDLTIDAARRATLLGVVINQTVVFSRGGKLALFASSLRSTGLPGLPKLEAFGILVVDDGVLCESSIGVSCCSFGNHRARVSVDGLSAQLAPGETAILGTLSFTVRAFLGVGSGPQCCDGYVPTRMVGFARGG
jgi:hypothetical protein